MALPGEGRGQKEEIKAPVIDKVRAPQPDSPHHPCFGICFRTSRGSSRKVGVIRELSLNDRPASFAGLAIITSHKKLFDSLF